MGNYVYYAKGTLSGTVTWDNQERDITPKGLTKLTETIEETIKTDFNEDLAKYLRPSDGFEGVVVSIKPGVMEFDYELYSWTRVETTRTLTLEEQKEILDYLTGQFSDGWGEGFEQTSVGDHTVECQYSEFDGDECEFYQEEVKHDVGFYVHFWQSKPMFHIELIPTIPLCVFTGLECEYFEEEENIKRCVCPRDRMPCRLG